MNLEWLAIHKLQQTHILHQHSIYANSSQLVNQATNLLQLIIVDNGVERYVDLGIELVGILAKLTDIIDTITNSSAGSEFWCSNIYGIGTMIDGSDTTSQILGRS